MATHREGHEEQSRADSSATSANISASAPCTNVLCKSPQTLPNSPRAAHRSIFANFSLHTRVWSSRTLTIRSYSERMASVCSSSPSYCIYSESFRAVKNTPSEHTPPRSIRPLTTRLRAYAPGPYAPGPYAHTPIRPWTICRLRSQDLPLHRPHQPPCSTTWLKPLCDQSMLS